MTVTINAERTRAPEDLALQRLRMLALGILGATVVVDALHGPLARLRTLEARVVERLDPLDSRGSTLISAVTDLLSLTDGAATKPRV